MGCRMGGRVAPATGVAPASRAARAETRDARAVRQSWAQLIKRIYEVDPLLCPSCGSEREAGAKLRFGYGWTL